MSLDNATKSYWLIENAIEGEKSLPKDGSICVIGSGLSGVSIAYWLAREGLNVTIVDYETVRAATFRNCGHILYGTVESMKALKELHGEKTARELWALSIDVCHEVRETVKRHNMDVEYRQDGYLVMAIDEVENNEIIESIELLNHNGFQSDYIERERLKAMGFKNVYGGRYEKGSSQAHPTKFRNALLKECLAMGVKYHSGVKVLSLDEKNYQVFVTVDNQGSEKKLTFDAAVIAGNAYSPLFSDFFQSRRLVEPFAGQIITSKPLRHNFHVRYPHSFDHGYEYAIITEDNRLMIGGWRNNVSDRDLGNYDLKPRIEIDLGLKEFVSRHYEINEPIEWEFSWRGVMAASKTGFPFIGPTISPLIYTAAGYTGHGFSWAHGSAKYLKDIMVGNAVPKLILEKCSPTRA